MMVQRFVAASAREAMRQVREALGDEAMIVANRRIEDGVEVLALDGAVTARLATAPEGLEVAPGHLPLAPPETAGVPVTEALDALRGSLETRLDGLLWGDSLRRAPTGLAVFRELLAAGFSAQLARALAARLPAELDQIAALAWARREIAAKLPIFADERALFAAGGVFALIGPTGVGKTTTTAKLAARCVMQYGAEKVAMVTTDGYRIGAHEQLLIYGRILGIPVLPAADAPALRDALHELRGKHIVLVDTIGMSQRDHQVAEQAALLCGTSRPVRRLLVLNAASQGDTLDEVAHAYRSGEDGLPMGCIISKVDEAARVGAVLDIAIRHRLPVHYVSDGQRVPENFLLPDADELIARAFAASGRVGASYAPDMADFAGALTVGGPQPAAATPTPRAERSLPYLRAAVLGPTTAEAEQVFDQTWASLQALPTFRLARQTWQLASGRLDQAALNRDIRQAIAGHAGNPGILVLHGRAPAASARLPHRPCLAASSVFDAQGRAIVAPLAQWHTHYGVANGWQGGETRPPQSPAESLLARIDEISRQFQQQPLVHLCDGLNSSLVSPLLARGLAWLGRCTPKQSVGRDGMRTTAAGLAHTLGYAPAGTGNHQGVTVNRWLATSPIQWPTGRKMTEAAGLRLIVLRRVTDAGVEYAPVHGLARLETLPNAERLADWLELVDAPRRHADSLSAAATRLGLSAPTTPGSATMLAAAQLGLLAYQLLREPAGGASALCGSSAVSAGALVEALSRLFAVMDLAPEEKK